MRVIDGLLTQNNTTIKLPIKNYEQSLKNFLDIKEKKISINIKFLIIE